MRWLVGGLVRASVGLAVVVAVPALVVLAIGDLIAARALERLLADAGFPAASVDVKTLDFGQAVASLRLGPRGGEGVERIVATYTPGGLLAGRLDRLELGGATIGVRVAPDGALAIAGRTVRSDGGAAGDAAVPAAGMVPIPPVDRLTVTDSVLRVETAAGAVAVPVDLEAERVGTGLAGRITLPDRPVELGVLAPLLGIDAKGLITASGTVRVAYGDGTAAITADECLRIAAEALEIAGRAVAVPAGACIVPPPDGPLATIPSAGAPVRAEARLTVPRMTVAAVAEVRDLAASLRRDGEETTARVDLALVDPLPGVRLGPLRVSVAASRRHGEAVVLDLRADGPPGIAAEGRGGHDPATGRGSLAVRLGPVRLGADGVQPAEFVPALADAVEASAGTVAATLRLAWGEEAPAAGGEILLDGVALAAGPVAATGISGVVTVSGLLPPVVPQGEDLAIARLDVGVPLTDGVLAFGIDGRQRIAVERARWAWAGGTVEAAPFTLDPAAPDATVELTADRVDLGRLLELVAVDGLDAAGTLAGVLPVRVSGRTVTIDGGTLRATGPGTIRYDPAKPPSFLDGDAGSPTGLLRGALTDFRYRSLVMTVDGTAGGELAVRLVIEGANPDFYDGYPVKLNLNVSGALDRILRRGLDAYRIPDRIRERMMEFGRRAP